MFSWDSCVKIWKLGNLHNFIRPQTSFWLKNKIWGLLQINFSELSKQFELPESHQFLFRVLLFVLFFQITHFVHIWKLKFPVDPGDYGWLVIGPRPWSNSFHVHSLIHLTIDTPASGNKDSWEPKLGTALSNGLPEKRPLTLWRCIWNSQLIWSCLGWTSVWLTQVQTIFSWPVPYVLLFSHTSWLCPICPGFVRGLPHSGLKSLKL